jgi:hypothetical protein
VVALLESGAFEAYIPDYFRDIVVGKFQNPEGFLAGTIAYARSQRS